MSQGFHALKEKIQYLFEKIDAGEKMLSVELDLLKAYTDALSNEINKNAESILDQFPLEKKNKENPIKSEDKVEQDKVQLKEAVAENESTIDVQEAESKLEEEKASEIEAQTESEVPEEKAETEQPIFEESSDEDEEVKEDTKAEQTVEPKIDEDFFEVTITDDEALPNEEKAPDDDKQIDIDEKTTDELQSAEDEVKEAEKEKTLEDAQVKIQQETTSESEVVDEDYGIGWKFKQAKPLGELIDLSEKYVFIQGLFNQDPDRFSKALRKMDEASGVSEALEILEDYTLPKDEGKLDAELLQKLKAYLRIRFSQ